MEAYSHSSRRAPVGRRGRRTRHPSGAFLSWRRQALLLTLALALALATIALLLLGDAMGVLPGGSPLGAPAVHGAAGLRAGATPTTPAGPGTFTLVSPSSARGPSGATLTFAGSGWGTTSVAIGVSLNGCDPVSNWQNNTITHVTPDGSGSFGNASGQWPGALTNVGTYTLCAYDGTGQPVTGPSYSLLSASSPTITLSASTAQVSQPITITGTNFLGVGGVQLTAQGPSGAQKNIGVVSPDSNGGFTTAYAPAAADVGTVTITAQSVPEGSAAPVLSATANLTVGAANTPTPTVSPTSTAAVKTSTPASTNSGGPSLGLIIALVVGILLALLIIVGVVAFLVLRRNNGPKEDPDGEALYGARDPTGRFPSRGGFASDGYGRGYSEEYPSAYGPTSGYASAPGRATRGYPGADYAGARDPYASSGGVAAWDDPPPDPNWRARPMTGRRATMPDDSLDGLAYPDLPTGAPGDSYDGYPTRGGWDEATGAYTNETGAYGSSGYTDETGAYGGAPYGGQPPANDGYGAYGAGGAPSGRRPTPGRAGAYPDYDETYGGATRPAGPPPNAGYPPPPLVPPSASGPGGPRSSPGRGGQTGGRGSAGRPPQPDPRRGGWDDPDASDDGRGGW